MDGREGGWDAMGSTGVISIAGRGSSVVSITTEESAVVVATSATPVTF